MTNKLNMCTGILLILLLSTTLHAQDAYTPITLTDIFKKGVFRSQRTPGLTPLHQGDLYCRPIHDSLNVYEYATGNYVRTIVTAANLVPEGDTLPLSLYGVEFDPSESRLLFSKEEESIYRYSSKAYYYIYDVPTKMLLPLASGEKQRLASFSPDGNRVAFVRDNNLFVADLTGLFTTDAGHAGKEISPPPITQITFDGRINAVINGATDWVYEEEFGFTKGFCWSPDSRRIAFYRFDETRVKEFTMAYYGELYPDMYTFKYPKAGEDNSLISVHIYDIQAATTLPVVIGEETDIYIPRIKWTQDPSTLALYRMNRHQNHLELLLADATTGSCRVLLEETNPWYIDITDDWTFLDDGKSVIVTSEKDGYNQIYHYALDGSLIRQLTSGDADVTGLYGIDQKNNRVYYQVARPTPMEREVWVVSLDGKKQELLTPDRGTNTADFSSDFSYWIHTWSDINTPPVIAVKNAKGKEVREIENNQKLVQRLREYGFSPATFFTVDAGDGINLNGWMIKPPDFSETQTYPVLFTIYGGPGSQTVLNQWGSVSAWNQYLAQQGIIVVSVDNRGTGARGEEFKKCTYLQLGKYETLDQIAAARYLGSLPYINKERMGMWGWSFGGYLTLSCLTKGADVFQTGVAVAPVTNWKYYDNIYTERFMRTPLENNDGYEENSPVNHAGKLTGDLLIIHGMADDNVHAQNTYDMVSALVAADKQFDLRLYPNSNHGIYTGRNTTWHNYSHMTDFILRNLKK